MCSSLEYKLMTMMKTSEFSLRLLFIILFLSETNQSVVRKISVLLFVTNQKGHKKAKKKIPKKINITKTLKNIHTVVTVKHN